MTVEERVRVAIGDLVIQNISLTAQRDEAQRKLADATAAPKPNVPADPPHGE